MNPQDAWNAAFHQLEMQLDRASFETWLRGAVLVRTESSPGVEGESKRSSGKSEHHSDEFERSSGESEVRSDESEHHSDKSEQSSDGVFVIGVRNAYARDMLQHRLYRNVRRVLSDVYGTSVELRFEINKAEPAKAADKDERHAAFPPAGTARTCDRERASSQPHRCTSWSLARSALIYRSPNSTPASPSSASSPGARTPRFSRRRSPSPNAPPAPTIPSSSMGASGWARPICCKRLPTPAQRATCA